MPGRRVTRNNDITIPATTGRKRGGRVTGKISYTVGRGVNRIIMIRRTHAIFRCVPRTDTVIIRVTVICRLPANRKPYWFSSEGTVPAARYTGPSSGKRRGGEGNRHFPRRRWKSGLTVRPRTAHVEAGRQTRRAGWNANAGGKIVADDGPRVETLHGSRSAWRKNRGTMRFPARKHDSIYGQTSRRRESWEPIVDRDATITVITISTAVVSRHRRAEV